MIIIGEKLNSSVPAAKEAMESRNASAVTELAKKQADAGADYLDVNTSVASNEYETLVWAVNLVKESADCGIVVDSPDADTIAKLYSEVELPKSIINSVTLEQQKLDVLLPVIKEYGAGVIALPISGTGMPKDAEERVNNAKELIGVLSENGMKHQDIYLDIVVEAAASSYQAPGEALKAAAMLRVEYPDIQLVAGLSNISFGLPGRALINRTFLTCAMANGLSAAILDPLDSNLMMQLAVTDMLLGNDDFCMNYITEYRKANA